MTQLRKLVFENKGWKSMPKYKSSLSRSSWKRSFRSFQLLKYSRAISLVTCLFFFFSMSHRQLMSFCVISRFHSWLIWTERQFIFLLVPTFQFSKSYFISSIQSNTKSSTMWVDIDPTISYVSHLHFSRGLDELELRGQHCYFCGCLTDQ